MLSLCRRFAFGLFLIIAALTANGAQAHLEFHNGDSFKVLMCGLGSSRTIEVTLGETPAEATPKLGCCDCPIATFALLPYAPDVSSAELTHVWESRTTAPVISPRSPLWPGAPPQGPPQSL